MWNPGCTALTRHACRAALAEQEAALQAAKQEQADNSAKMTAATARFSKALARLADDGAAVAADRAEQVRGLIAAVICDLPSSAVQ